MARFLAFLYGTAAYVLFLGAFLFAIGFVTGLPVPKTIDSGTPGALVPSLIINGLLLGVFARPRELEMASDMPGTPCIRWRNMPDARGLGARVRQP